MWYIWAMLDFSSLTVDERQKLLAEKRRESAKKAWVTRRENAPEKYPERPWRECKETGCWVWLLAKDRAGYGRWSKTYQNKKRGSQQAHRVVYEDDRGVDLRPSQHLHHLCGRKDCVNPEHLEVVHGKSHIRQHNRERGEARTHCSEGHEFAPENTYYRKDGGRRCRICQARRDRKRYRDSQEK